MPRYIGTAALHLNVCGTTPAYLGGAVRAHTHHIEMQCPYTGRKTFFSDPYEGNCSEWMERKRYRSLCAALTGTMPEAAALAAREEEERLEVQKIAMRHDEMLRKQPEAIAADAARRTAFMLRHCRFAGVRLSRMELGLARLECETAAAAEGEDEDTQLALTMSVELERSIVAEYAVEHAVPAFAAAAAKAEWVAKRTKAAAAKAAGGAAVTERAAAAVAERAEMREWAVERERKRVAERERERAADGVDVKRIVSERERAADVRGVKRPASECLTEIPALVVGTLNLFTAFSRLDDLRNDSSAFIPFQ